jgi:tRNA (adenine37-N6)-methyltransferase
MMSQTFTVRPIGVISTPWRTIAECPRNGRQHDPAPQCSVRVFPEYVAGLRSIEGFSHLLLLYWLDQSKSPELVFTPPFDGQPRGVFATRAPRRPNPIGLSVVAFDGFAAPDELKIRYLDCLDGTPLIDLKPDRAVPSE